MQDLAIELNNVSVCYLHNKRGIYSIKDFVTKGGLFSPFDKKVILNTSFQDIIYQKIIKNV
mgnify:CR=1 FL=1